MLSTVSCGSISPDSLFSRSETAQANPVKDAMAACPTPIYPSVAAWDFNNSLPRETQAQIEFRNWTARVLVQQTLLDGKKPIEN